MLSMSILIYTVVIFLVMILFLTLGNVVFSVSELKDNNNKKRNDEINILKIGVFILAKILTFALVINLLMYYIFNDHIEKNNCLNNILILIVSFQIIFEMFSINKILYKTTKKINSSSKTLHELLSDNVKNLYSKVIYLNPTDFFFAFGLNICTITYIMILMLTNGFTLFYQNLMIYFFIIVYIKYLTICLYKDIHNKNKKKYGEGDI